VKYISPLGVEKLMNGGSMFERSSENISFAFLELLGYITQKLTMLDF